MNGFQDFQDFLALGLGPAQVLRNLAVACSCGLLVAYFYQGVTQRQAHQRTLILSLVALSLITALVIMVIGNNLARAFGMVGAMSIIRFRTAVKDVQDVVFIFFSLGVGMAAGVGMYAVAYIGTGAIGAALPRGYRADSPAVSCRTVWGCQAALVAGAACLAGFLPTA